MTNVSTRTDRRAILAKRAAAKAHAPDGDADRELLTLHVEFQQIQADILPTKTRYEPLSVAYEAILKTHGHEAAKTWGHQSEFWTHNATMSDSDERATNLIERMIDLRPKTLAGIAAVAASLKEDQSHFWDETEKSRDWDILLVTKFIDALIECGAPAVALNGAESHRLKQPSADPVFAAVERHRVTWRNVMDAGEPDENPQACEEANQAFEAAENALLATAPVTIDGARVIIAHLIDEDERCHTELSKKYLPTLLRSPVLA